MLIAVDYDGTFTADPDFWRQMVALGRARGHEFVCVTGRSDERMLTDPSRHWGDEVRAGIAGLMPIVFAGDDYKSEAAVKAGYKVNVWCDDHPEWVGRQGGK